MSATVSAAFPFALAASVISGFGFWYSLNNYERARYYPFVLGIPVLIFAALSLTSYGTTANTDITNVFQAVNNPFNILIPQPTTATATTVQSAGVMF